MAKKRGRGRGKTKGRDGGLIRHAEELETGHCKGEGRRDKERKVEPRWERRKSGLR